MRMSLVTKVAVDVVVAVVVNVVVVAGVVTNASRGISKSSIFCFIITCWIT